MPPNGGKLQTITDNLVQKYMEYIPDYLKPFIIHKGYFPELIEDSWFNNPVYWKGRLISPQNETKFKLYFCGELIDNSIVGKQTSPLAIYADSVHSGERITLFDERYNGYEALLIEDKRELPLSPEIQFVDKDAEKEFEIIILGCSNTDFDDEYPATEQVQLINGDRVNKEYLKRNAFDFISILIRNAKGQVYTILEMELC